MCKNQRYTRKTDTHIWRIIPRWCASALFAVACTAPITVFADDNSDVLASIDARSAQTHDMAKQLWDYAELGYLETQSSDYIMDALRAEGFTIKAPVAGLPTAFIAEYGTDGPVIAMLAEFDALGGFAQDAVPVERPIKNKVAGHACGHNLFAAGSVTAAIAVKDWLAANGRPGRIRLYGTPAEEGGSGKVYMVREGTFEDVDIALHWHPSDRNDASAFSSLANRSAKFRFKGQAAHAAAGPWLGRSALDGVEAMNMMVNMAREHMPPGVLVHHVITHGGHAPNVVPADAEVFYYMRHETAETLLEAWPWLENAARGAALGTGTDVEWEIIHGNNPILVNETLARRADMHLRAVGGLTYTPMEQTFAEELHTTLPRKDSPVGAQETIAPFQVVEVGGSGSTDVGDVSRAVPTVGLRTATWVPGTVAHSWQATSASGMSIGFKGSELAAKVLALTAIDLYKEPELRRAAKAEYDTRVSGLGDYTPLLGDRDPPLDYRKAYTP